MMHRPGSGVSLARPFAGLFAGVLAGVLLGPGPAEADLGGYTIDRFHTDLTVEPGSDLLVEETIAVVFTEPRHGIYRSIPVRYTDGKGYAFSLGFRLLSVTDEAGRAHGAKVTNQGRYVKIRIGDADRTVSGPVTYVLRYRVQDALGHFVHYDELYWNATGTDWSVPIGEASARVFLPAPLPADSLRIAAYSGRFGERGGKAATGVPEAGTVSFSMTRPLGPQEGLTVAVGWPSGYVTFPGTGTRLARGAAANWILLVPFLFLAWLIRAYRRSGRDPDARGTVVVRYEPPEGVTAAELGTLVDETVDLRDITAGVVGLAVRGYVTIRVEEKDLLFGLFSKEEIVFERRHHGPEEALLPYERRILNGLFEDGDVVSASDLKQAFYRHIPKVEDALYTQLAERKYFAAKPSSVRRRYAAGGVLLGIATVIAGVAWGAWRGAVFPLGAVVPIVSGFLTAALFVLFSPAMPRRTRSGARMRDWALGFQEFVDRVERDRLAADEARNVFESLLPYAMALGIASKWARKFEGIYETASPAWYVGATPFTGISTRSFEQSLSSSMNQVGRNMMASPRSSGSGGGGFSGGGGGGGGGGSW
jgi:uncharacterized membrane protein YgcG